MNKTDENQAPEAPASCPVAEGTEHIQELAHGLSRTMRRLRRDLAGCKGCPLYLGCSVLAEFNRLVSNAIDEINEEWSR